MKEYHKSVTEYSDVRDCMDYAMERGREEGMEKGRISKSFEIAGNLLNLHFPVDDIAKVTGLTPEQILTL